MHRDQLQAELNLYSWLAADTVTGILTPAGTNAFHGVCTAGAKGGAARFDVQLTDELVEAYKY